MADIAVIEEVLENNILFMEKNQEIIDEGDLISSQPLIALQSNILDGDGDSKIEVIEEVIDQSYDVPNIAQEQEISSVDIQSTPTSSTKKRKPKSNKLKSANKKSKNSNEEEGTTEIDVPRKWERKKVQIKTLEGEFSVTVWASGKKETCYLFLLASYALISYFSEFILTENQLQPKLLRYIDPANVFCSLYTQI